MASQYIPKLLHQIYFDEQLPPVLQVNVDRLKTENPHWSYRLYGAADAEDFIAAHYGGEVLHTYRRINPAYYAARADFLRYLIVYELGGVYLDIKTFFDGPIDNHLRSDDRFILSQWRNAPGQEHEGFGLYPELSGVPGGEYQNFYVIAEPRHPFLRAVIDRVSANIAGYRPWHAVGRTGTVRVTGPVAYTRAIQPLIGEHPCRIAKNERAVGICYSVPGYAASVRGHYSELSEPVVRLSPMGELMSRFFVALRNLKAKITARTHKA